ncbi:MAG: hypothetical protein HKN87_02685 [Saprospiraceae bacterium]|nr:hypothetical protein [Saprospiraceae bacterium]
MENWELEFEWLRVQHIVRSTMNRDKLPDLQAVLFLIGIQELGHLRNKFSKEEKQDLMHIATCKLLEGEGFYEFVGRDEDGWPHYQLIKHIPKQRIEDQEWLLKRKAIDYFRMLEAENGGFGEYTT